MPESTLQGEPSHPISLRSIGVARSPVQRQQTGGFLENESVIELDPDLQPGLRGLEGYSHLIVLFWMHEQKEVQLTTRPQGHPAVPKVGIFACR